MVAVLEMKTAITQAEKKKTQTTKSRIATKLIFSVLSLDRNVVASQTAS